MTNAFIAGSRQVSRLPAEVKGRIDTRLEKGFTILAARFRAGLNPSSLNSPSSSLWQLLVQCRAAAIPASRSLTAAKVKRQQ